MAATSHTPSSDAAEADITAAFSNADSSFGFGVGADRPAAGWLAGKTLGAIGIESFIAAGGMGEVYRGRERGPFSPCRPVAVKVMKPERAADRDLEAFRREILALGRINHPGVARIFGGDVGVVDGRDCPYFVMELVVGGETVVDHARRQRLGPEGVVGLLLGAVEAIAECHRCDVIHSDLKPGNILVDAAGRTKVVDFGLARVGGEPHPRPAGTPAYMSPEAAAGEAVDARVDVYALGVVLYELLAGRVPREFSPSVRASDIARTIRTTPVPPTGTNDAALEAIVRSCLAADPRDRCASASRLHDALHDWRRQRRARPAARATAPRPTMRRHLACERLEPKLALAPVVPVSPPGPGPEAMVASLPPAESPLVVRPAAVRPPPGASAGES